ncbi:MAG: M36 family metallopeptidase [Panacagrimonas sp.]
MKRLCNTLYAALILVGALTTLAANAVTAPTGPNLPAPDFDVRRLGPVSGPPPSTPAMPPQQVEAIARLRTALPNLVVRVSERTGSVRHLFNRGGSLTGPDSRGAWQIAEAFLLDNLDLLNLDAQDLSEPRVTRNATSDGLWYIRAEQQVGGFDVFGGEITLNVDAAGRVVNYGGEPVHNAHASINAAAPLISSDMALDSAIAAAGIGEAEARSIDGLVYFPLSAGELRLAWSTVVEDRLARASYRSLVDAVDGRVLWRFNGIVNAITTHGLVYDAESPQPNNPFVTTTPATVTRVDRLFHGEAQEFPRVEGTPVFSATDLHYDWWAGMPRTDTGGNNVVAQSDYNDGNYDPNSPTALAFGDLFTYPLDLGQDPRFYSLASTVNLFWWVNHIHDVWYRYGWTEQFANYQNNNFGLGGLDDDFVFAEAQSNSDDCNAEFNITPKEGNRGYMTMYTCFRFPFTSPPRDTTLDQTVIIHEYHHGMAERLRPSLHQDAQGGGIGEGGGDFQALLMLSRPGDDPNGFYGVAGYSLTNNATTLRRDFYSIRPLGTPDAPGFTYGDLHSPQDTISFAHDNGEIWANALWYARTLLVGRYGFVGGTETAMRLQIDGYKFAPSNPDFLDMRDSILIADILTNASTNQCLLWSAFARMGIGLSATSKGQSDSDPVEAFDTPAACRPNITVTPALLDFGPVQVGGTKSLSVQVCNSGNTDLFLNNVLKTADNAAFTVIAPGADGFPLPISPAACKPVQIRCAPAAPGATSVGLRLESNDLPKAALEAVTASCLGGDTTPNAFSFIDVSNVARNSVQTSNTVTITGIDAPTPISVSGGMYSIGCTSVFTGAAGSISNGQAVCVRHTASPNFSTSVNTTLTVGGVSGTFTSTTLAIDTTPNAFTFIDVTNVPRNSAQTSNPVAITGINTPVPVSVSGGMYSIGCTTVFTSAAGSISDGQAVCVRHTASPNLVTSVNTTLTVGGVSDTFTSTTAKGVSSLTAQPAVLSALSGSLVKVQLRFEARLAEGTTSLVGKPIVFNAGSVTCTATTNATGTASCTLTITRLVAATLVLGYDARFVGDATYLPSTAHGPLISALGVPVF